MKRTILYCFLVAVLIGTARTTNAQTEKGKILLGGQSSLEFTSFSSKWKTDNNSGDNGKIRYLDIIPQVGYFIANNLAVGLEIPYSFSKEIDEDNSYTTYSFSVVPFARYYFGKAKLKPYLHGGIGPGWGKNKSVIFKSPDIEVSTNLLAYELGGGLGIFINEHVSLDLGLGYASASSKWVDPNTNTNWQNTVSGIGANIGIVVCL